MYKIRLHWGNVIKVISLRCEVPDIFCLFLEIQPGTLYNKYMYLKTALTFNPDSNVLKDGFSLKLL